MKLFTKIAVLVIGVLSLAVVSSMSALFSSSRLGDLVVEVATENLSSIRAAEELEIALLEQRGLVSSYILDNGNPFWLEELKNKQQNFATLPMTTPALPRTSCAPSVSTSRP